MSLPNHKPFFPPKSWLHIKHTPCVSKRVLCACLPLLTILFLGHLRVVCHCGSFEVPLSAVPAFGLFSAPVISISLYDFIHVKQNQAKVQIYRKGILGSQTTWKVYGLPFQDPNCTCWIKRQNTEQQIPFDPIKKKDMSLYLRIYIHVHLCSIKSRILGDQTISSGYLWCRYGNGAECRKEGALRMCMGGALWTDTFTFYYFIYLFTFTISILFFFNTISKSQLRKRRNGEDLLWGATSFSPIPAG